MINDLMLIRH